MAATSCTISAEGRVRIMEILISIGIFALGVISGIVLTAFMVVSEPDDFEDVLQDTYDRGF